MFLNESDFAQRMQGISGSAIREIFHLVNQPGMISFAGGMPASSSFDTTALAEIAAEVLTKDGIKVLQYGASEGWVPLKESISEWFKLAGVIATPNDILPLSGSQQGMDLLFKVLINPGDVILVESPTFLGALQTMRTYQAKLVPMETDENGVIPESVEELIKLYHPKVIYVIPTFQNPTGNTMSLERRKKMAELAAKYRVILLEDDPYRDLRYTGDPLPPIKTFDEEGWVVYLGSFSKIISPGLRVAAAVAHPTLMRKMVIGKQASDVQCSNLSQAIVDAYLRKGLLMDHIKRIRVGYATQMNTMLDMMKFMPSGIKYTKPEGGIFLWATLPEGMDTVSLLPKATAQKVAFVPGTHFFCDGGNSNTMRLNFSNGTVETITQGMKALAGVIADNLV